MLSPPPSFFLFGLRCRLTQGLKALAYTIAEESNSDIQEKV